MLSAWKFLGHCQEKNEVDELYTQAQRELHSLQVNDLRDLCEERRPAAGGRASAMGMKHDETNQPVAIGPNHIELVFGTFQQSKTIHGPLPKTGLTLVLTFVAPFLVICSCKLSEEANIICQNTLTRRCGRLFSLRVMRFKNPLRIGSLTIYA